MQNIPLATSPVEEKYIQGRPVFLKRDDLLHTEFSGNKARKFYHFLNNDFPKINKLISYGSPQANSLYSLSALAKLKNWSLDFYVHHVSKTIKENPRGNYRAALDNHANIIEKSEFDKGYDIEAFILHNILPSQPNTLFIPEGGHCKEAADGINLLAEEIKIWAETKNLTKLKVALPSGTGTTALFLQQSFNQQNLPFEVLTCACVGGDSYLKKQFSKLSKTTSAHPTIMPSKKKYHFGKLYDEFYSTWTMLNAETGVEFELLYDPLGWLTLIDYLNRHDPLQEWNILYLHQGGILGNETMLTRYQRRYTTRK